MSRAITKLERQLRAELVHRTTHTVALSTAGVALYERVAPHLAELDQAVRKLPEGAAIPSGELRMTAPQDFGLIVLPEVLAHFARRYPEINVDVRLTNARIDLVADGFDLAVRVAPGPLKDSTLAVRRLGDVEVGIYASPSYLARRGQPKQLGEAGHDWILHTGSRIVVKTLRNVVARFVCDDFLLLRQLAREGAGIAPLPRFVGTPFVRDGLLVEVHLRDLPRVAGQLFLVYPSSGQVSRKVTAFRDFLLDWLKRSPLS